jgi:hypothetical protein
MHKGFKCLDFAEGQIYISRDVIFDETVFPLSKLNPNVGAHLLANILLLPTNFQPFPVPDPGVKFVDNPCVNVQLNPVSTNPSGCHAAPAENSGYFGGETGLDGANAPDTVLDCDLAPLGSLARPDGNPSARNSLTRDGLEENLVPCTTGQEFSPDGHVSSTDDGCGSPSGAG